MFCRKLKLTCAVGGKQSSAQGAANKLWWGERRKKLNHHLLVRHHHCIWACCELWIIISCPHVFSWEFNDPYEKTWHRFCLYVFCWCQLLFPYLHISSSFFPSSRKFFFFLMCPFDPSLQMITSSCSSHLSNSIPTIAQVKNSVSRLSFSHFIANTTAKILALPLKSSPNPSVPCRSLDHIPVQDTLSWPLGNWNIFLTVPLPVPSLPSVIS